MVKLIKDVLFSFCQKGKIVTRDRIKIIHLVSPKCINLIPSLVPDNALTGTYLSEFCQL